MSISFVKSLTFMFKEKNWFAKFLIGSVLLFFVKVISLSLDVVHSDMMPKIELATITQKGSVSIILLYIGALFLFLLAFWMYSTVLGYMVTTVRRYMRSEEDIIPDWDDVMGKLFFRGARLAIALGVYFALLFLVFYFILFFLIIFLSIHLNVLLVLLYLFNLCFIYILPAMILSYCEKDRFSAAFDFKRIKDISAMSLKNYLLMLFMLIVLVIGLTVVTVIFYHTTVGILILPIVCFYFCIVLGNIVSQYYVSCCIKE